MKQEVRVFPILFLMLLFIGKDICIAKRVIGIPCPGCGMTRAFMRLLSLDIRGALYYHPLFILPVLAAFVFLFRNNRHIARIYRSNMFWVVMLVVVVIVWIVRMIILFPDKQPMDLNEKALLLKLLGWMKSV